MLKKVSAEQSKVFTLPDTKKKMMISGSLDFVQNVTDVLNILIHSPSALKILNHNASLPHPLLVEEFKEALDLGRNTGQSVQLARKYSKNGAPISKYKWLTLLPHELRHSYNAKFDDSHILHSLAYAVVNEADAQAIEGLIALELSDYIKKNPKQFPDAKAILSSLSGDPKIQFFKQFYDQAQGTDVEKKQQAMSTFIKEFSQHPTKEGKTFSELAYQTSLERDTTQNGWERCSEEELKQIEGCLLGKVSPEAISNETYMHGRKKLHDESSVIRKEWPTFCQRIMDGTFHTDVISYGKGITSENLIETISPQLAHHFLKVGGIPMDLEQGKKCPQENFQVDLDCIDMPPSSSLEKTLEKMHKQGKTVLQMHQKRQKESSKK